MDRPPYLILLFVAVIFVIVLAWGIYSKLTSPAVPIPAEPSSQPTLLQRMQEKLAATRAATLPSAASTQPATAPATRSSD